MAFNDEIQKMCEEMAQARGERSHAARERTQGVNRLMKDVRVLIQHFHTDRGEMSEEMEKMLEQFAANNQKETRKILHQAHGLLKQHHTDHQKMAQQMGEMLKEFVAKNQKEAHKILGEARKMVKEFRSQHEAMSEKQRAELESFQGELEKDVKRMMEKDSKERMVQFKQMMTHLRKELSEVSSRSQAVRKEASSMVHGYRAEHKKGRQIWQEFAGGKHRSPRAMPLKEEEGEKEKTARTKLAAEGRQAKVLAVLEESPDGMTHKELAYAMGMQETALSSLLSRMLKIKLIRRKKNLYSMT